MSILDILKVKRTEMIGDAKNVVQAFFEAPKQATEDTWTEQQESDESAPVDTWQHYGFVSRLPKGAEALVMRFGQSAYAIASRALTAAKVFGSLGEGDVALYTSGGNVVRLNTDGSITMLSPSGSKQHVLHINKDGLKFVTAHGIAFEISDKNGFYVNAGDKDITLATTGNVQHVAKQQLDHVGVHYLHAGAKLPMAGGAATPTALNVLI